MVAVGYDSNLIILESFGQYRTHTIIDRFDIVLTERIVRHIDRRIDRQAFAIDRCTFDRNVFNRNHLATHNSVEHLSYIATILRRNALSIYVKRRCRK